MVTEAYVLLVITADAQVRKLMEELQKHGNVAIAAVRSGEHPNCASREHPKMIQ